MNNSKKYFFIAIAILASLILAVYLIWDRLNQPLPVIPGGNVPVAASKTIFIETDVTQYTQIDESNFDVLYTITLRNTGVLPIINLSANSWFNDSELNTFEIISLATNSNLTLNQAYDGKLDRSLLSGANVLAPKSTAVITLRIKLNKLDPDREFINFVDIYGDDQEQTASAITITVTTTATPVTSVFTITSNEPVVFNFVGLRGTAATTFSTAVNIGYGNGVRLAWNTPGDTDCVRSNSTGNINWVGASPSSQGFVDVQNLTQTTVFTLTCGDTVYNVTVNVANPTVRSVTTVATPAASAGNISSAPAGQGGNPAGQYNNAQVTFNVPGVANSGNSQTSSITTTSATKGF